MKKSLTLSAALVTLSLLAGGAYAQTKSTEAAKPMDHGAMKMEKPMSGKMQGPAMSEEGRKIMQEAMDKMRNDHKAHYDEMKAKKEEMKALLKAPTFDKKAYLAKEMEIQAIQQKMHTARAEMMADVAEKLKPEDRALMGQRRGPHHKSMQGKGPMMDCPMMGDKPAMEGEDKE